MKVNESVCALNFNEICCHCLLTIKFITVGWKKLYLRTLKSVMKQAIEAGLLLEKRIYEREVRVPGSSIYINAIDNSRKAT
jgi:hypothetical protein